MHTVKYIVNNTELSVKVSSVTLDTNNVIFYVPTTHVSNLREFLISLICSNTRYTATERDNNCGIMIPMKDFNLKEILFDDDILEVDFETEPFTPNDKATAITKLEADIDDYSKHIKSLNDAMDSVNEDIKTCSIGDYSSDAHIDALKAMAASLEGSLRAIEYLRENAIKQLELLQM